MSENKNSWPVVLLSSSDINARKIYEKDWSQHSMGPIENWSKSFISILTTSMGSQFPALMLWGKDFITFYNAGYAAVLGDKQYWALGVPLKDVWPEAWESLYGMLKGVLTTGIGSWAEDQIYYLHRNGYPEESYFTFSFARILDEDGGFGGILCTAIETTPKVIGERRLATLREIASRAGSKFTVADVYSESLAVLKQNTRDIPFAILRIISNEGSTAKICGAFGIEAPDHSINLPDKNNHPALTKVFENGIAVHMEQLPSDVKQLKSEIGLDPVKSAYALPIRISLNSPVCGFLSLGLSPHLPFDDAYRSFLDLLGGQISAAVASAKVQEEARERVRALAELDQMKTTFFSNVSHEFRTPLTLLLGPLQDALERSNGTEVTLSRKTFESVHRNALRLLKLVNSLLDFSRMEVGKAEASFEPVDLASYTRELAGQFQSVIEKGNLTLEIKTDRITEPVYIDREMWEKIILNLLSNAFKFTFDGLIQVFLKDLPSEVELTVQDTGIGISKEELPKLFNRFYRVEGARSRTFEGSGIGLALVQDLVKAHAGKIVVESTEGKGTYFRVTLKKGKSHLPSDKIQSERNSLSTRLKADVYVEEASRWVPEITNIKTHNETKSLILVVDDNADMREYLISMLSQDFSVLAATNGKEAMNVIQDQQPDLVISDIMMPEMNGFELLNALRREEKTSRLPVIFLSARAGNEATVEGLEAGADDYLIKPFSAKELLARVKTQLSMVALRSALMAERNSLQRSNTELEQFAHIASHDLQEPLRKISNFSNLLERSLGDVNTDSKSYLDKINHAAARMHTLISGLLNLSQLSKEDIVFEKVDLNVMIQNIQIDFDLTIEQKGATIECSVLPTIEAIPIQMTQLFSNLFSNALKYIRKDVRPVIKITASLLSQEETNSNSLLNSNAVYYKIEFKDNGIGVDEKYAEQIFKIFQRLHVQSDYAGTGIGLALCKKIIQNHHGDIFITTKNKEPGTIFNIILPEKQRETHVIN